MSGHSLYGGKTRVQVKKILSRANELIRYVRVVGGDKQNYRCVHGG